MQWTFGHHRAVCGGLLSCAIMTGAAAQDVIHLRSNAQVIRGDIQSITDAGITIRSVDADGADATREIPWDRVGRVEADTVERRLDTYASIAEQIWRSRTRLERGDSVLAEPGFERQFERYRGQSNETALVVAEGLLRCRLARLANADVIIPALEVVRLRRSGVQTASYLGLTPVFDEQLGLCPLVAPLLVNDGSLRRLVRDLRAYQTGGDDHVGALRDLYIFAVQQLLGDETTVDLAMIGRAPGLRLMRTFIEASSQDNAKRRQARDGLIRMNDTMPPWIDAWRSIAIGMSLMQEDDLADRLEGMVRLSELPAMQQHRGQHHLIGLALDALAAGLQSIGDTDGAESIRSQLSSRYPTHPIHNLVTR